MSDVDFVVTWIDGADPKILQDREHVEIRPGRRRRPADDSPRPIKISRYHQSGEIYYLLASILKYAPFVRRIHIVTDDQKPPLLDDFAQAGLCDAGMFHLVSHDTIFAGLDALRPSFNPRMIEAAMWRIPGLAEHFVFSNDDMFLNAPLTEGDFFRDGRPLIHGSMMLPGWWIPRVLWRRLLANLRGRPSKDRATRGRPQERGARLAGVRGRFLMHHHHPHPLRRSTIEAFYAENPEVPHAQMQHQFRDISQYVPVTLSNHLEHLRHGVGFGSEWPVAYLDSNYKPAELKRQLDAIRHSTVPFGCVQSLERFAPGDQALVHTVLKEKFSSTLPPSLRSNRSPALQASSS